MGGIGAQVDFWNAINEQDDPQEQQGVTNGTSINTADIVGGLVFLAGSYIRQDFGCGAIDFSQTQIPMASVFAELDGVMNRTRFDIGQEFVSGDGDTLRMLIVYGGNHGLFGHYNYTLRTSILGQNDGR